MGKTKIQGEMNSVDNSPLKAVKWNELHWNFWRNLSTTLLRRTINGGCLVRWADERTLSAVVKIVGAKLRETPRSDLLSWCPPCDRLHIEEGQTHWGSKAAKESSPFQQTSDHGLMLATFCLSLHLNLWPSCLPTCSSKDKSILWFLL